MKKEDIEKLKDLEPFTVMLDTNSAVIGLALPMYYIAFSQEEFEKRKVDLLWEGFLNLEDQILKHLEQIRENLRKYDN